VALLLSQPKHPGFGRSVSLREGDGFYRNQLHDAAQNTIKSTSQTDVMQHQNVTPPPKFTDQPLTPTLTDKKPFAEAPLYRTF
jgi:hypothetical protein